MQYEYAHYLVKSLEYSINGALIGFVLGMGLMRSRRTILYRSMSLGMGVGAGYALQEANSRFRNI